MRPILMLTLAFVLTACSGSTAPEAVVLQAAGSTHEAILGWETAADQPVVLATQGVVDIEVDLFAGTVRVEPAPLASATKVAVRRVGTHGWGRGEESMESLGDIRSVVALERRDGVDTVVVKATTEHPEPHFQRAEVTIQTPEIGSVRVRTSRGNVRVEENRGPVDIVTTRGWIRVMTPWAMREPMQLVTTDGLIDLRIRGESTGWFDAETVGGTIKARVLYGRWQLTDNRNDGDSLRAWLNDGENPVVLRTSNADIIIMVTPDPVSSNPFAPLP